MNIFILFYLIFNNSFNFKIKIFNMDNHLNEDLEKYYNINQLIGKGSFGKVYIVEKKDTKEKRAIKIFQLKEIKEKLKQKFFTNEITDEINDEFNKYINSIIN